MHTTRPTRGQWPRAQNCRDRRALCGRTLWSVRRWRQPRGNLMLRHFALTEVYDDVGPTLSRKYLVDHGWALLALFGLPNHLECMAKAQSGYTSRCCRRRGREPVFIDIRCIGNISGVNPLMRRGQAQPGARSSFWRRRWRKRATTPPSSRMRSAPLLAHEG